MGEELAEATRGVFQATCSVVARRSINSTIMLCEQSLVNANAGIEHWLLSDLSRDMPTTDGKGDRSYRACRLGFAKVNGEWHLVVQRLTKEWYVEDLGGGDHDEGWCVQNTEAPTLLSQASRDLRIAALEQLPELIQQLTTKARQGITTIERAQKLVS